MTSSSTPSAFEPTPGRVLIAVCTLNEADNITEVIAGLREGIGEADILIVDDNSTDGTGELVEKIADQDPAVRLLVRRDERGLGSAIRLAITKAIEGQYEYFLNLDGDLSHDPKQLPALLEKARQSPELDVVIGSRYIGGGEIDGWPMRRRLMSRMVNGFATLCLRLPVSDCSGSMRCYRVAALANIGIETVHSNGYSVLEELLVKLRRGGSKMGEVPITFTDRVRGESKLTTGEAIRSATRMLSFMFK